MSALVRTMVRSALVVVVLVAAHEIMLAILDGAGLVERLLAPGGDDMIGAAVLGVTLLVLRLTLLFVVPGAVLTRLVQAWIDRNAPTDRPPGRGDARGRAGLRDAA